MKQENIVGDRQFGLPLSWLVRGVTPKDKSSHWMPFSLTSLGILSVESYRSEK